jgi:hypothetical protein
VWALQKIQIVIPHLRQFNFHIRLILWHAPQIDIDTLRESFVEQQQPVHCVLEYLNNNYGQSKGGKARLRECGTSKFYWSRWSFAFSSLGFLPLIRLCIIHKWNIENFYWLRRNMSKSLFEIWDFWENWPMIDTKLCANLSDLKTNTSVRWYDINYCNT